MELSYWTSRWNKGNTGFHMENGYPGLIRHWSSLPVPNNPVVLVPLCGKSYDLIWLAEHSKKVIGCEISETAVLQFFSENNLTPATSTFADFTIYTSNNIEIWLGDFLKLPERKIPKTDLIFDKAALVALPPEMRKKYADKILKLSSSHTHILLHHFIYNQKEMNGPPFSVTHKEIEQLFGAFYTIKTLEKSELLLKNFKKFQNRGLKSELIEYLLLLSP